MKSKCSMKIKRELPPSPKVTTKTIHNNNFTGYSKICEMPTPSPVVELQIPPQKSDSQRAQREKEMKLILDLARQGKTASEIERETGYNKTRVLQMVNRYAEYGAKLKPEPKKKKPVSVKPPKPPKPPKPTTGIWTEENINKLIALHQQGLAYSEIARELGVTKNSVTSKIQRLIHFGILESRMDHILWSEEDLEKLSKLREDGKTWEEIGQVFCKSGSTCQVTFSRWLERGQKCRKQSE